MAYGHAPDDAQNDTKKSYIGGGSFMPPSVEKSNAEQTQNPLEKRVSTQEHLERIELVAARLKERYAKYNETAMFVDYLRSSLEVFARAGEKSIEDTQDDLIRSEIYVLSQQSGIDEEIFHTIYDDFKSLHANAARIQEIADNLIAKYKDCGAICIDFIQYIKDYVLIFSQALEGKFTLEVTREKIIAARMSVMAQDNKPPLKQLQDIYTEFKAELQKEGV